MWHRQLKLIILLLMLILLVSQSAQAQDEPTPYDIALQRIEEARENRAIVLNLSQLGLTELPPEIGQLNYLEELVLYDNELTTLPEEIGLLSNLCFLNLRGNNIHYLPTTFGNLHSLTKERCTYVIPDLQLDGNPLISPPSEIVEQGTGAILAYLRNQAWYHTQRLIFGTAGGVGLLALLMLGFRFKQRGARKEKPKRDAA